MVRLPKSGILFVLLGLLVVVAGLWLEELIDPKNHHALLVWLKLVDEVGIALFLVGSVSIILEFRDWKDYFRERIKEIIVGRDYLKALDNQELISLQTNTLKAFFKIDDIDRKDSFLQFFHSQIHGYIGSPYREDVRDLINISYANGRKDQVEISETISFRCRRVGERIQDSVRWTELETAGITLGDYEVQIQVPHELSLRAEYSTKPWDPHGRRVFKSTDNPNSFRTVAGSIGFELSLKDYKNVDDLHVKTQVHYTMPTSYPITWTMSHPTKSVTGTITYPPDQELITNFFGMKADEVDSDNQPGVFQVGYHSWLLPDTGFAFQLMQKMPRPAGGSSTQVQKSAVASVPGTPAQGGASARVVPTITSTLPAVAEKSQPDTRDTTGTEQPVSRPPTA